MERRKRKLVRLAQNCDEGREVDLRSDNSDSKTSRVQPASSAKRCRVGDLVFAIATETLPRAGRAVTERSVDIASAAGSTIAGENSDSNHGTAAENVEDQSEESEEGFASKEASEDDSEDGVKNCSTRETGNGLLPAGNVDIAVGFN